MANHPAPLPESLGSIIPQVIGMVHGPQVWPAPEAMVAGAKRRHITSMVDDARPSEAILAESVAFDLVLVLVRGGSLPVPLHRRSIDIFGPDAINELIDLVGLHALASSVPNLMASRPDRQVHATSSSTRA